MTTEAAAAPAAEATTTAPAATPTTTTEASTTPSAPSGDKPAEGQKPEGEKKDFDPKADDLLFDEKKEGEKKEGEEGEKKEGDPEAPVAIDFEQIKLPEGMTISEENKTAITEFTGKHKLTQEAAQDLADIGARIEQARLDGWQNMKKEWRGQVEADPQLGGQNIKQTVSECNDIIRKFAGNEGELKELQDDLIFLGLGNKKSFVRFLKNVHAATKEDGVTGKSGGGQTPTKSAAQRMYPNMKSENDPA